MTVDDKVGQFLKQNRGKGFCDACIAKHVKRPDGQSINRFQAGNATRPLRSSSDFKQEHGVCSECGKELKKITLAT